MGGNVQDYLFLSQLVVSCDKDLIISQNDEPVTDRPLWLRLHRKNIHICIFNIHYTRTNTLTKVLMEEKLQ